ncbi:MAG: hypothetical protein DMG24_14050 [Acidobacteria bacterium]|nr:MAG: hypothetical protein DMG24_14050 [Acidobacteriota bacterium]
MDLKPADKRRGHERRDASIRNVVLFGVALGVTIVFGLLVSAAVFHYFAVHQPLGPPASPFENVRTLPPAPRLQVTPAQDLQHYRADEDTALNSYGWVDRKAGVVRIPIDRAMDLLLAKGLPVRSTTPAPGTGEITAGEVQQYTVPKGYTPQPARPEVDGGPGP